MKNDNRRKNLFQKKIPLYRSIFSFLIFSSIGIAVLTLFYTIFSTNALALVYNNYHIQTNSDHIAFLGGFLSYHWFYLVTGGFFLVLISISFTHRFAGPLSRFEISLDKMINKDFGFEIDLRKNDECKPFAQKINLYNRTISSAIKTMKRLAYDMDKNHNMIREKVSVVDDQIFEALNKVVADNRRLMRLLSEFNISC